MSGVEVIVVTEQLPAEDSTTPSNALNVSFQQSGSKALEAVWEICNTTRITPQICVICVYPYVFTQFSPTVSRMLPKVHCIMWP